MYNSLHQSITYTWKGFLLIYQSSSELQVMLVQLGVGEPFVPVVDVTSVLDVPLLLER